MNDGQAHSLEFDDASYTAFRKRILRKKGGTAQRRFLRQVRVNDEFIAELDTLKVNEAAQPALIPLPLTENEYKDPPIDTEQALYRSWSGIVPAVACRSTFWARLTLEHIRHGRIDSAFLAANGGSLPGGAERSDRR